MLTFHDGQEGFWFGDHWIRIVRSFVTDADTTEEPGFVVTDLAKALEMQRPSDLTDRLKPDQKGRERISTPGGIQIARVVSEPGLYRTVLRSDKPQAEPLMEVVTREILPRLRKTGRYRVDQEPTPQDPLFGLLEGQQPSQELIDAAFRVRMYAAILQRLGKTPQQSLSVALRAEAKNDSALANLIESAGGSFALAEEIPEVTLGAAQVAEVLPNDWDENFCRTVCEALGKQYQGCKGGGRAYLVNILAERLGWLEKTYGPKSKKHTWQLTTEGQKHGIMKLALIPNANRTSEKMNVHYFKSAVELIITKGNQIYRDHINSCIEF